MITAVITLLLTVPLMQATELPLFQFEDEMRGWTSPVEAKCTPGLTPAPGSLSNYSAVIIVTSHDVLGDENCTSCAKTGVFGEELFAPYYMFRDAGMNTSIVTIAGGDVPVDSAYNTTFYSTSWDKRWWGDARAYRDSHNTLSIK